MFHIFMVDLVPIFIIMALGYISGKRSSFTETQAKAFNKMVLTYALPAALFVSITKSNRAEIFQDSTLTLVSTVVLVVLFMLSYFSCKYLFKRTKPESAVCALIAGSPTVGFLGFAVLEPIYGTGTATGLVVAIVAIIVNAITIPLGLFLLGPQSSANGPDTSKLSALYSALKEPVVWAPVLAVCLVMLDIHFPPILDPTFDLIAKANAGVAVFAAGLTLSAHKFEFDREIVFNTFYRLILTPAIILVAGIMFGIQTEKLQMLVLIAALPPAFSGIIIASRYDTYVRTGTSSLAVSTIMFVITAPMWIYLTQSEYIISLLK